MTHSVLVIPGMEDLHPTSQYNLTKRMDPTCGAGAYGHAKEFRHNKSVLRRDGVSVPYQPQVQVLGQGKFEDHCGMDEITLRHPTHFDFHNEPLTDKEVEDGYTRFIVGILTRLFMVSPQCAPPFLESTFLTPPRL